MPTHALRRKAEKRGGGGSGWLNPPPLRPPRFTAHRCGYQDGVTLIETLIAMLVLTFGLLAVAQLFVLAVLNNTLARSKTFATEAAQQTLEDLQAQYDLWLKLRAEGKATSPDPFPPSGSKEIRVEDLSQGVGIGQTGPTMQGDKQIGVTYQAYNVFKVEWKAEREPDTQNVYRVEVTVNPTRQSKFNQPVRFTTYFAP